MRLKSRLCAITAVCWLTAMSATVAQADSVPAVKPPTASAPKSSASESIADPKHTPAQQAGKVLEVLQAGSYVYLRVDTGKDKLWLGAPATSVKPGQKIVFGSGTPMANFESKSLGRKFDMVYLVEQVSPEGAKPVAQSVPENHPKIDGGTKAPAAPKLDFSRITKPAAGKTVAEIYKEKVKLVGQKVAIRGKVVKFNSEIMGKNWIHLRDGTGAEGSNDLTVTTEGNAKVGDTVLVRGVVTADKDFGHGYKYPLIIEDAQITVE